MKWFHSQNCYSVPSLQLSAALIFLWCFLLTFQWRELASPWSETPGWFFHLAEKHNTPTVTNMASKKQWIVSLNFKLNLLLSRENLFKHEVSITHSKVLSCYEFLHSKSLKTLTNSLLTANDIGTEILQVLKSFYFYNWYKQSQGKKKEYCKA